MHRSLRQRIRSCKINCKPWNWYRGEIKLLPISAQTLFANNGAHWDILEIELIEEGWMEEKEKIWEVLSDITRLMMPHLSKIKNIDEDPFDGTWTEEDYKNFYDNGGTL